MGSSASYRRLQCRAPVAEPLLDHLLRQVSEGGTVCLLFLLLLLLWLFLTIVVVVTIIVVVAVAVK